MKKVLIISSSPRKKGNSEALCDQFLKGAKASQHEVEKVFIHDMKLNYCMACESCKKTQKCIYNDGMNELLEKMIEADVIVLSTPVYFYSLDGQMKVFIDRCFSRYTDIQNKDFYFIITAADRDHQDMQPTIESLRGFLACLPGAKEKGILYGTGAWGKGDVVSLPVFEEAYEVGKAI